MKSKQINFFLTREDVEDFYQFLNSTGWGTLPVNAETAQPKFTYEKPNHAFFVLKKQAQQVLTKYIEKSNSYKVLITNSPAVEFWVSPIDTNTNTLFRGRIYMTCEYFNSDGLVEKSAEFLNASKNLLSWFRRQLLTVKENTSNDLITSINADRWAKENNGRLVKNNLL